MKKVYRWITYIYTQKNFPVMKWKKSFYLCEFPTKWRPTLIVNLTSCNQITIAKPNITGCNAGEFQCERTRKCIGNSQRCDRQYDCGYYAPHTADESDETGCAAPPGPQTGGGYYLIQYSCLHAFAYA